MLPEPLRALVVEGAAAVNCDGSFIALPALAAIAGAIGTSRVVVLKRSWAEAAILWTGIVGESGTAKSPAFRLALAPVRSRQSGALKRFALALAEYEAAKQEHAAAVKAWRQKGGDTDPPTPPRSPVCERILVSDCTVESLVPILLDNPRGLLLARDELAGWFGSLNQYKQKGGADAAIWLSMFNAESIVVDRKGGLPPTLFVPRAGVSVTGGIQPGTLRRSLTDEHRQSGFAARLLLAWPPRRAKRWTEDEIDEATETRFAAMLDRLCELEPGYDEHGDPKPLPIGLRGESKRAFKAFVDRHGTEQATLTGDLAAAWSKIECYAARLALVLHLAEWADGNDPIPGPIELVSMNAGIKLAEWFAHEARRVYAMLDEGEGRQRRRELVELIGRKGGSITARELMRSSPRQYRSAEDADTALDSLAESHAGRWEVVDHGGEGGRPARRFVLVNGVDVDTTPTNPAEGKGSVSVGASGASRVDRFDPDELDGF